MRDELSIRFTPFEHFMLEDDRDLHPMSFFLRLNSVGPIDQQQLIKAVEANRGKHPLFFATVGYSKSKPHWRLNTTRPCISEHTSQQWHESRQDWAFDLERESGLRVSLGPSPAGHELWLQVHHCCCDARGTLDFACDVLAAYANETGNRKPDENQDVQTELGRRGQGTSHSRKPYLWPLSDHWKRVVRYYWHRTVPLINAPEAKQSTFRPAFLSQRLPFSREDWRKSRETCEQKATFNDLLLTTVFRRLAQYFQRVQGPRAKAWLRLAVPIDQRISHGECRTAANCSSMVFLDRHTSHIARDDGLLSGIAAEMKTVKAKQLSTVLNEVLGVFHHFPGGMGMAAKGQRRAVTAVVSNLGELRDDLSPAQATPSRHAESILPTLTDLDFLVPLRQGTAVSVGVATYRSRIHFCLHYDARLISTPDAQWLIDGMCSDLARIVSPC